MDSKNKSTGDLYRGINEFKWGCSSRSNLVKNENGKLFADSHTILNSWNNCFSQLLNVHNITDVRQVHTVEPLVPPPSRLEVETAIAKLSKYKSPRIDQILAEMIQAGGEILLPAIHRLINYVWNKVDLLDQWEKCIIVPMNKKFDNTD
jgi:hypothetical protein